MIFFIIIISILLYAKYVELDAREGKEFYKYFFPIFMILSLLYAFQNGVGTDYENYIQCATANENGKIMLDYYIRTKEYLFAFLLYISHIFKYPQMIFIFSSLIQNILFAISLENLNKNKISSTLFLTLYFVLSLSFFNQFNVIRQFISIQLLFLSFLFICNGKTLKSIPLIILAPFFHKSSIIIICFISLFYFLKRKNLLFLSNKKILISLSICLLILYFIDINNIIFFISKFFNLYKNYVNNIYTSKMTLAEIITKLIKLIVVFYSVWRLEYEKLSDIEKVLYNVGCFSILIMILSFSSTLIWRIYLYFDIFLIFPVLFFFKYNATIKEKKIILLYLTSFLIVKILLIPRGEYLYRSILLETFFNLLGY